jgi:phosphate:Na+ symporter
MLRKILLPTVFGVLAYGFWLSPHFKEIAAGVAIFLFGMLSLENGFKAFTGGALERVLTKSTDSLPKSIGFGVLTTTIMQSSSLVSVITISFLSAGLLSLASGIGIIFGANIGTTTGAWLVAGLGLKVKLSVYAMPMLVFGVIMVFQKSKVLKGCGYVLAGLGFLFLGIHYMKSGFEAYRTTIDLTAYAITGFGGLLVFTLIGVAATVIMQSSHATLVLIITALASQQITYENALALAIGANVGTTITAILGALSSNHEGKRLAGAHLIFNVVTGLVAIIFIHQFVAAVEFISANVGIRADDYTLKLAVFHTLFNLLGVIIMVPFVNRLVVFLEGRFKPSTEDVSKPRYLANAVVDFPETLLEAVRNETHHLYDNAFEIMAHGMSLHRHEINSDESLDAVVARSRTVIEFDLDERYVARIKVLYAAILEFSTRASLNLNAGEAEQLFEIRAAGRAVVAATKDVKHLRKNVLANLNGANPTLVELYDTFRSQIAGVMRDLYLIREGTGEVDVFDLDDNRALVAESNLITSGRLDDLIRRGDITAAQGSSLINDQLYVRDVVKNLVSYGIAMHGAKDSVERDLEQVMTLEPDDIEDLLDESMSG